MHALPFVYGVDLHVPAEPVHLRLVRVHLWGPSSHTPAHTSCLEQLTSSLLPLLTLLVCSGGQPARSWAHALPLGLCMGMVSGSALAPKKPTQNQAQGVTNIKPFFTSVYSWRVPAKSQAQG